MIHQPSIQFFSALRIACVLFGALLLNTGPDTVLAASASAPLGISATVVSSCKFTTVSSPVESKPSASGTSPVKNLTCSSGVNPISPFISTIQETSSVPTRKGTEVVTQDSSESVGSNYDHKVIMINF